MKNRPVLISAISLSIIVEIIMMILVYNQIGGERLPPQFGRLIVQFVLICWILSSKSNIGLFLLSAYHVVTGLFVMYSNVSTELLGQLLIGFHLIIGFSIYFHDSLEDIIGIRKTEK